MSISQYINQYIDVFLMNRCSALICPLPLFTAVFNNVKPTYGNQLISQSARQSISQSVYRSVSQCIKAMTISQNINALMSFLMNMCSISIIPITLSTENQSINRLINQSFLSKSYVSQSICLQRYFTVQSYPMFLAGHYFSSVMR